jgi:hypothetical protein
LVTRGNRHRTRLRGPTGGVRGKPGGGPRAPRSALALAFALPFAV